MKNYETPKIKVVELETEDIIQTSGTLTPGDNAQIPGTGGIFVPTSLDKEENK